MQCVTAKPQLCPGLAGCFRHGFVGMKLKWFKARVEELTTEDEKSENNPREKPKSSESKGQKKRTRAMTRTG